MTNASDVQLGIGAVEQETGLSKELLRTWERRYGFPNPTRDARGDRAYPIAQIEQLQLVRQLMDAGHRPGALLTCDMAGLQRLRNNLCKGAPSDSVVMELLAAVRSHDAATLKDLLRWHLLRLGMRGFVFDVVAPLAAAIGDSWSRGDLNVYHEHLCTAQLEAILRSASADIRVPTRAPSILLATPPGEHHRLGVLMLESLLATERAQCLPLANQMPIAEISRAARSAEVDIVALSFSSAFPARLAQSCLVELRASLPARTVIWAGGAGMTRARGLTEGLRMPKGLEGALDELQRWRAARSPA